jgi:outer membrane immunogenic protein
MTFRLISVAATAASLAALAAGPAAAQAQPSPWSGWYAGANIGSNWGDNSMKATVSPGNGAVVIPPADVALINSSTGGSSNKTGFTGGIEGGYNYQTGDWLWGLETDWVALDVNERTTRNLQSPLLIAPPITYALDQRAKTNWMWSLRPRLGYVSGPWLFYGTAGIATSDIKVSLDLRDSRSPQNVVHSENSSTKTGWIAGLGAGYAITPQWSLKGEWLYADFGSISTTATSSTGFANLTSEAKVRSNMLRIGADYRF